MESGNKTVCCPVCTLFMREGVTLESHLDTHPKDKVIEALVKLSCVKDSGDKDISSDCLKNVLNVIPSTKSVTTQCVLNDVGNFMSPRRGSTSAGITYQSLVSSGGTGATVLPKYVPVPNLLNVPETGCKSPVVFNPFLFQQQQVQVITAKKPATSKQFSHQVTTSVSCSIPFQACMSPHLSSPSLTPTITQARMPPTVSSSSQLTSNSFNKVACSDSLTDVTQVYPDSFSQSLLLTSSRISQKQHLASNCINSQTESNGSCRNSRSRNNSIDVSGHVQISEVSCNNSRLRNNSTEISERTTISEQIMHFRSRNNSIENNERVQISQQLCCDQLTCALAHSNFHQDFGKEMGMEGPEFEHSPQCVPVSCDGFLKRNADVLDISSMVVSKVDCHDNAEGTKKMVHVCAEVNQQMVHDSPCEVANNCDFESSIPVQSSSDTVSVLQPLSPGSLLRVRNDLSCSIRDTPCSAPKKVDQVPEQKHSEDPELISVASSSGCIIPVLSAEDEYITSDSVYNSTGKYSLLEEPSAQVKDDFANTADMMSASSETGLVRCSTSESMNLVQFDSVNIVSSEFVESPGQAGDNADSSNDSHVITELMAVPPEDCLQAELDMTMNIQTDEMMPPKGELSEQESVGGNDSSLWAPVSRADDDVCASYDLLARESWEASDGSDGEGNGLFSPSISKKLNLGGNSDSKNKSSSSRATRKPKVGVSKTYLCITCNKIFNCPKERRVHQRTSHHGEGGSWTRTVPKRACRIRYEAEKKGTTAKSVKKEIVEDKNPSGGSEFTKFEEVFIVKTEEKEERDEGSVGEDYKLNTCKSETQPDKKESQEEGVTNSRSIVTKDVYTCSTCAKSFATLKMLRHHIRNAHFCDKTMKLTCKSCDKRFPNENLMQAHFKIHPLECTQCGKYFYRRQNLKLHIRRHLGIRPFKCDICDKSFITRQKLQEHINIHTGNAPLKCSLCDYKFRRYSNLIQHKNSCHLKIKKKVKDFACHCGEIFHSKKKLEWHKETHETKPKSCSCCSEKYIHERSLTRHIRKAHDRTYIAKHSSRRQHKLCNVCGVIFLKSSLPTHMRVHTGSKPFACPICGKHFTTKWNLNLHRWTHASRSSKPFKCSLCKSAFFRQSDFKSHMHSHRNVRPYTCNYCGCQFIRKYNCQRHVREHERNKLFTCNICNKMFHRNYYLTEHMRIHSGSRPFVCHICGKASSTKSNHNKHVKIHHAREPVNTEG